MIEKAVCDREGLSIDATNMLGPRGTASTSSVPKVVLASVNH